MTLAELVRESLRTLARTAHLTVPLGIAFELPLVALELASDQPLPFSVIGLYSLVTMVADGAVLVLADQALRERELATGEALGTSLSAFGRSFLTGLVANLTTLMLTLLLIVPGIWRALTYAIAIPIAIHEGRSGVEACTVSAARMKGHLGVALVALGLAWMPLIAIEVAVFVADESALAAPELPAWYSAFTVASYVLPILATLPVSGVQAVLYHRTHPHRARPDAAEVAEVFR